MANPKLNKKKENENDDKKEEKNDNTTNEKEENNKMDVEDEIEEEKKEDTKINKKVGEKMENEIKIENKNIDKKDKGGNKNEIIIEKESNNINNNISPQKRQIFSRPNILKSLMDQNQTIYLQNQLRTISKEELNYIIGQLKGNFREIMKDKNGNYLCSDLYKECDQEQRIKILTEISPSLSEDCLNNYASHSIQTLIDRASSEKEYKLILSSFNDYYKLFKVSLDPCGAYTIQKIIERIPDRYREEFNFIFSSFIGFTSRQKYGIVTVKKFISGTRSVLVTEQIMRFVEKNFMNLSGNQYANYLIQYLLEKWNNTPEGNKIKKMVRDNFEKLSEKKNTSFICELYIKIISPEEKNELYNSFLKKIESSNNHFLLETMEKLKISLSNIKTNNNINNNISSYQIINNKEIQNHPKNKNNTIQNGNNISSFFSKENILNALYKQDKAKYLQNLLKVTSKNDIDYIISQLKGIFRKVMKDKNGNYFCSDLFNECDQEQRIKILKELSPTLSYDCLDTCGSYAIQTLIDKVSSKNEYNLILSSFNDINTFSKISIDPVGSYTIQKIIEKIPEIYREEFNSNFVSSIGQISKGKFGIVASKKFIYYTKNEQIKNNILGRIKINFMPLAEDQYANYLIQCILEEWNNTPEGNEIKKLIRDNFEKMCVKKYSSFICEEYIKIITQEEKNELINLLNINKILYLNNEHSKKILKKLGIIINNNNNSKNQISKNWNNNKNNSAHFMPNNNYIINNQNKMNSNFFRINNSNGNNIINNFNIPFNNTNGPNDNF